MTKLQAFLDKQIASFTSMLIRDAIVPNVVKYMSEAEVTIDADDLTRTLLGELDFSFYVPSSAASTPKVTGTVSKAADRAPVKSRAKTATTGPKCKWLTRGGNGATCTATATRSEEYGMCFCSRHLKAGSVATMFTTIGGLSAQDEDDGTVSKARVPASSGKKVDEAQLHSVKSAAIKNARKLGVVDFPCPFAKKDEHSYYLVPAADGLVVRKLANGKYLAVGCYSEDVPDDNEIDEFFWTDDVSESQKDYCKANGIALPKEDASSDEEKVATSTVKALTEKKSSHAPVVVDEIPPPVKRPLIPRRRPVVSEETVIETTTVPEEPVAVSHVAHVAPAEPVETEEPPVPAPAKIVRRRNTGNE